MRDIALCHPRLRELAEKLVKECAGQGLPIKIGETLRTAPERTMKAIVFLKGSALPGKSWDFAGEENGRASKINRIFICRTGEVQRER